MRSKLIILFQFNSNLIANFTLQLLTRHPSYSSICQYSGKIKFIKRGNFYEIHKIKLAIAIEKSNKRKSFQFQISIINFVNSTQHVDSVQVFLLVLTHEDKS